ncbi:MAG: aminodeoxychorismate/anthranilate synthase component II [Halobacteriota archaeon]|nr:aminodeoxychorismate/anthranilate synthase component II [Halobacteriota archaeon]
MKVLFINNFDSFVWNLVDYVSVFEGNTVVVPNTVGLSEVEEINPDAIIVSPGPGNPTKSSDIGSCLEIIKSYKEIPMLGICLGHQAIAVAFGGKISRVSPVHGKTSEILHDEKSILEGIPNPLEGGRYHSLIVSEVPKEMDVSARAEDPCDSSNLVMGIRHKKYPMEGLQFHPESILTPEGLKIIENFIEMAKTY